MTKPVHLRVIDAAKTQPPPPSDLPTIKIEDGSLPENVAAVGAALARAPDLFTFGERFVHLHRSEKGAVIVPVEPAHLMTLAGTYASLFKFDGRSGADRPADCPRRLADAYLARRHFPEHKRLSGVVEAPTITADGRCSTRQDMTRIPGSTWHAIPRSFRATPASTRALTQTMRRPPPSF